MKAAGGGGGGGGAQEAGSRVAETKGIASATGNLPSGRPAPNCKRSRQTDGGLGRPHSRDLTDVARLALGSEARAKRKCRSLKGPVKGGHKPAGWFSQVLDEAFEAQLDGVFGDEAGGLAWLAERMAKGVV